VRCFARDSQGVRLFYTMSLKRSLHITSFFLGGNTKRNY